jgi:hypothetical protein
MYHSLAISLMESVDKKSGGSVDACIIDRFVRASVLWWIEAELSRGQEGNTEQAIGRAEDTSLAKPGCTTATIEDKGSQQEWGLSDPLAFMQPSQKCATSTRVAIYLLLPAAGF